MPNNAIRTKYALFNFIKHISSSNSLLMNYSQQILDKYANYTALKQEATLRKMIMIVKFKLKLSVIASFYRIKQSHQQKKAKSSCQQSNSNPIYNSIEAYSTLNPQRNKRQRLQVKPEPVKNTRAISPKPRANKLPSKNKEAMCINDSYTHQLVDDQKIQSSSQRNNKSINRNKKKLSITSNPIKESTSNKNKSLSNRSNTTLEEFHSNRAQYIRDHNNKLYALQLEKQKQFESLFTFQPIINRQPLQRTRSLNNNSSNKVPRYITLNKDAIEHKRKMLQLRDKLKEEEESERRSHSLKNNFNSSSLSDIPSEIYYEKLYHDAYDYKQRKRDRQKEYHAEMTFQPDNGLSQTINRRMDIKSTFKERNQRSIENKRRYQSQRELEEREIELKIKKERLPKERIQKNNRSVIERLYLKYFNDKTQKEMKSIEQSIVSSKNNKKPHKKTKANTISIESLESPSSPLLKEIINEPQKDNDQGENDTILSKEENKTDIDPHLFNAKLLDDIITNKIQ